LGRCIEISPPATLMTGLACVGQQRIATLCHARTREHARLPGQRGWHKHSRTQLEAAQCGERVLLRTAGEGGRNMLPDEPTYLKGSDLAMLSLPVRGFGARGQRFGAVNVEITVGLDEQGVHINWLRSQARRRCSASEWQPRLRQLLRDAYVSARRMRSVHGAQG